MQMGEFTSQGDAIAASKLNVAAYMEASAQVERTGRMVRVPKGKFLYGFKKVEKDIPYDFEIDAFPVTNAQYKRFIDDTRHEVPFYETEWAKEYSWDREKRTYFEGKETIRLSYNGFIIWRSVCCDRYAGRVCCDDVFED